MTYAREETVRRHADSLGQRAHVTLVFSDLCDYTRLSELLDPEEIDAIRSQLDELSASIILQHEGFVTQVYGDGRLCVFGYPQPTEDDVRRSIDAALELHKAVRSASWPTLPDGFELRLHTGVHSGLVFVRTGTEVHGRYQLSGDAVNTASRLCGVAQRDEIVVTASTLYGSEEYFETAAKSAVSLRGKSAPQDVVRILGRTAVRTRFEARMRRGLTTFVNRQTVLAKLTDAIRPALPLRGRLLVIHGAAGIGKTRLLAELSLRAGGLGVRMLRGTCENYGELVPLEPFSQILRQVFGMVGARADAEQSDQVEQQCQQLGASVAQHCTTYRVLMGLQQAAGDELAIANVVEALQALIDCLSVQQPLAIILDDWQWADGASRSVLGQLRDATLARGASIVVGARSQELIDPMLQPDEVIQVTPLSGTDSAHMMAALRPNTFSPHVGALVLQRAGGNPLFLEELCLALPATAENDRAAERLEVPATVQGVIQARFAGLPDSDRMLMRMAAVMGIEFNIEMLAELSGVPAPELLPRLAALGGEDLIYPSDNAGSYHFKHGLTREVVYESVLIAERRLLHAQVAELIERAAAESGETMATAEALAYHFRNSGDLARAARYAESAGDQAMVVTALDRACQHYLAAMAAFDAMPPTPETRKRWLSLSSKWGLPYVFSPVKSQLHVLDTAVRYAAELGNLEAKARLWHWLGWAHYGLGNYKESIVHFRDSWQLAEQLGETRLVTQTQAGLGQSQAAAGDYPAALQSLTAAVQNKRTQAKRPSTGHVAPGFVFARASLALVRADQGDFDDADRGFEEALSSVRGTKHAIEGSATALQCIALLWRGRWQDARAAAERGQQNARVVNSAFNFVTCSVYAAYASWELTHSREALDRLQATVDWIESQHLELYASCDYGWLAQALFESGELVRARSYVERALRRAELSDPMGEAAAHRVLASLAARGGGDLAHVEACLERAREAGERRGSLHEAVKTELLRAQLHIERGAREEGVHWAERCATQADALGMHSYADRARALVAGHGAQSTG
jgi:class 3 adenylate cyclase/tetratricopeptide (TPR) repeat protein